MENLFDSLKYLCIYPSTSRIVHCTNTWNGNTTAKTNKFFYVLEGGFVLNIEDQNYFVQKNQLAFLPANMHHSFWLLPNVNLEMIDFEFRSECNGEDLFKHYGFHKTQHVISVPKEVVMSIHNEMTEASDDNYGSLSHALRVCSGITKLCHLYIQSRINMNNAKLEFADVIHYMADHITEDVTLDELATLMHLESTYFSAKFKKETGMSPMKYFAQMRTKKAAHLLRTTDLPLTEIAALIGMENVYYFKKYFEKHMGVKPERYKDIFIMPSHVHPSV